MYYGLWLSFLKRLEITDVSSAFETRIVMSPLSADDNRNMLSTCEGEGRGQGERQGQQDP